MELSLGGLLGAMTGAVLGALNYVMIAAVIDGKLRAAGALVAGQTPEELERRIASARRGVLAFDMPVFVGAGYWTGQYLGG